MLAYVGVTKTWGAGVPLPEVAAARSTANKLACCLFRRWIIALNLVILGQTLWAQVMAQKLGSAESKVHGKTEPAASRLSSSLINVTKNVHGSNC